MDNSGVDFLSHLHHLVKAAFIPLMQNKKLNVRSVFEAFQKQNLQGLVLHVRALGFRSAKVFHVLPDVFIP